MSAFQKYRYECLAGMLTVVLFIAAFYFTATNADAQAVRSALLVFVIADGIGLYFTLWSDSAAGMRLLLSAPL